MELSPLTAISAIDGRYRKQVQHLDEYFSEYALMKYRVLIEVEYALFLEKKKVFKLSGKAIKHLNRLAKDFGAPAPRVKPPAAPAAPAPSATRPPQA